jgi:hypothetical protein
MTLSTSHDWIRKLAAGTSLIAGMGLETSSNTNLNQDGYNRANSDPQCDLIVRAIDELLTNKFMSRPDARELLSNLIARNTYGALIRCRLAITTQIPNEPRWRSRYQLYHPRWQS